MNQRLISVFAFALLVASVTSFVLYRLILSHVQAPQQKPAGTAKIIVATHNLQVGALIKDGDVSESVISGPVPEAALTTLDQALGRGVVTNIYEKEILTSQRLAAKGAGAGLAATIPVGMRALAMAVNEVVGLAGFVSPGMRVDVLVSASTASADGNHHTFCHTILQNIEVLSAGQKVERNVEGKPESAEVVNLLVTPEQAEALDLASTETKVQLVLRNPLDVKEQTTNGISLAKLLGQKEEAATPQIKAATVFHAAAAALPRVPDMAVVEVFNGTKKSEQKY